MIHLSDAELVEAGRTGSPVALTEMLRRNQSYVRAFLRRLCDNVGDADDLAQETFLTAFASLHGFRGDSTLRVWLCGIAFRKASTDRRGAARRKAREAVATDAQERLNDPRGVVERTLDVQAAFKVLTPEQRAAAALCLASDMTHSEAAAALSIPLGTLKSRVSSARKLLIQALEAYR